MVAVEASAQAGVEVPRVRMPERVTEKWGANPHHRKPKGSAARVIRGGLVGPKAALDRRRPMDNRSIFLYYCPVV